MISRLKTIGLCGLDTFGVDVEVTVRKGKPYFSVIGLGDSAVKESKERVQSAIVQSGFMLPDQTLVNLAPAEVKKEGAAFDVAIALGMLVCSRQLDSRLLRGVCVLGELTLDGGIRAVRGALTLVLGAHSSEFDRIIIPLANLAEATLLGSQGIIGVSDLRELIRYLKTGELLSDQDVRLDDEFGTEPPGVSGFSEVWGQDVAKRALSIAAAGRHNILMLGPPGCGKSMLAERFTGILPKPSRQEVIEMVSIHSAMGQDPGNLIAGARPYRAPHHTISEAGLIGGGSSVRAGEITLSHGGVLFLDEFPEFRRSSIEALRSPLETGAVTVSRAKHQRTFPANFQLLAAMNPCPCGKFGYAKGKQACLCGTQQIQKYLSKLSFPILERIDLQVELEEVPLNVLASGINSSARITADPEKHGSINDKVEMARQRQSSRAQQLNSKLTADTLTQVCKLSDSTNKFFINACSKLEISARSFVRLLRVSRTIADLEDCDAVSETHIAEALSYRALARIQNKIRA